MGSNPLQLAVGTPWVRAETGHVAPAEGLARKAVVRATCKPRTGRTTLEGTRRQAA
jgi:hypothetical protein